MIINIGIDILEKKRIKTLVKKHKNKIIKKILSSKEINELNKIKKKIELLSKIFTAKEAISKALGTGFRKNIKLKKIKILKNEIKKPYINFKKKKIYISISHEKNITITTVIIINS